MPVTVRAYEALGDIENESFDLSGLFLQRQRQRTEESVTAETVPENRELKVAGTVNGPRVHARS